MIIALALALSVGVWAMQVWTYSLTARAADFNLPLVGTVAALLMVNIGFATRATPGNVGVSVDLLQFTHEQRPGKNVGAVDQPGVRRRLEHPPRGSGLAGDRRQDGIGIQQRRAGPLALRHLLERALHAHDVPMNLEHEPGLQEHRIGERGDRERLCDPFFRGRKIAGRGLVVGDQITRHRVAGKHRGELGAERIDLGRRLLRLDEHNVEIALEPRLRRLELDRAAQQLLGAPELVAGGSKVQPERRERLRIIRRQLERPLRQPLRLRAAGGRRVVSARNVLLRQFRGDRDDLRIVGPRLEERIHDIIHQRKILGDAVDHVVEHPVDALEVGVVGEFRRRGWRRI